MCATHLQNKKGGEYFIATLNKCGCQQMACLEIKPRRNLNHPGITTQYRGWIQKIESEWCHLI